MKLSITFATLLLATLVLSGCKQSHDGDGSNAAAAAQTASQPAAPKANIQVPFESVTQGVPNEAKQLKGAGSTFGAGLYGAWFNAYNNTIGVNIGYEGIGSGSGVKELINREVDFAGSDAPMTDEQMASAKGGAVVHIPTALGAIVPTYNIPNMSRKLKFTGEEIADIYLGVINKWNDPRLVADNPQLANIDEKIVVVHRADGSGTTYGFTDYLSSVNSGFKDKVGKGTSVTWPVGLGAEGNGGVAKEIRANPFSFGYVELNFAIQDKLAFGMVRNKAGKFIDPSMETVSAAASSAVVPGDLRFTLVNASGDRAYPICTATWIILYRDQTDASKALATARMLWWATHEGQSISTSLNYAPVPREITARSEELIKQINVNGKPVFAGK